MKSSLTKLLFCIACLSPPTCATAVAQEQTTAESPQQSDRLEKQRDWDSLDGVEPATLGADSRDLNNIDPTIVPFEGEMPGPLGSESREIGTPTGGTGPTIYEPEIALGDDGRSATSRVVGTIYQLPDGQLRFMLRPETGAQWTLDSVTQDDPDAPKDAEVVDLPLMTSGSYDKPLGFGSRGEGPEHPDQTANDTSTKDTSSASAGLPSSLELGSRQLLPKITGITVKNESPAGEIIHVGLLMTFVDRDGFVYNKRVQTLRPGSSVKLDAGGADSTKCYYLIIRNNQQKWMNWGNSFNGATVHRVKVPILDHVFDSFKNKFVATEVVKGNFVPLLTYRQSKKSVPATRIKPTGRSNLLTIRYKGNGNGSISIR